MKFNPMKLVACRRFIPAIAFAASGLVSRWIPAQTDAPATPAHVATIKLKLVMENMQETIDAQQQVSDLQKHLDEMTKSHQADLKVLQDKAADPKLPNAEARDAAINELDAKSFAFRQDELSTTIKIQRLTSTQLINAFREINSTVKDLATRKSYDVVMIDNGEILPPNLGDISSEKTETNLIFGRRVITASEQTDISIDVIAQLNKGYKSPPGIAPRPALPTTAMQLGSKTFQLEIAGDEPSREHGLMERDTLGADHGMIFIFSEPQEQNFWMHHTRFPLDIVYVDAHGKVVSVKGMKPYDESAVPSDGDTKYAIELSAGQARAAGIKAGDMVKIPAAADAAVKK